LALASPVRAAPPSAGDSSAVTAGPTSDEEAAVLWKDGKSDFEHGLDEDAIPKLERLVARYPGYPGFIEAHRMLARAYLRTGQPAKAKPLLQAYIQGQGHSRSALEARLELARAELGLKLYSEALLVSVEATKLAAKAGASAADIRAEALMLRARAQMGLGQDDRASSSVRSALTALPSPAPSPLAAAVRETSLKLKLRGCARFPSRGKLTEGQVRDQLGRRGACLHGALLQFKEVLATGDTTTCDLAQSEISEAFASYWKKCRNPPPPPPVKPKDRNAQQLKTYFRELAVVLEEDCRRQITEGRSMLTGWEAPESHVPGTALDALKKASKDLADLSESRK
jgi:hypothetical protein